MLNETDETYEKSNILELSNESVFCYLWKRISKWFHNKLQTYIFSKKYKFLHNFILAPTKTLANEFSMFLLNLAQNMFSLTLFPKLFLQNFSYFFQEYFYWNFLLNFFLQLYLSFFPRICFPWIFYQSFMLNIFQRFFSRKCSANNFWGKKFCETS